MACLLAAAWGCDDGVAPGAFAAARRDAAQVDRGVCGIASASRGPRPGRHAQPEDGDGCSARCERQQARRGHGPAGSREKPRDDGNLQARETAAP
ncbi:MAG: hypothetical protein R3F43_04910 [bacterium]